MAHQIILASGSEIRQKLLIDAGLEILVKVEKIDEPTIRERLERDGMIPQKIAEHLAAKKAQRVSVGNPEAYVIGCDQILALDGEIFGKPETIEQAHSQLVKLRARYHTLLSAVSIYHNGQQIWCYTGLVNLKMRDFSDDYLGDYLNRNWHSIRHSVGGYKLEEEGIRLFSSIEGDYFTVLGLPLLALLTFLTQRGELKR